DQFSTSSSGYLASVQALPIDGVVSSRSVQSGHRPLVRGPDAPSALSEWTNGQLASRRCCGAAVGFPLLRAVPRGAAAAESRLQEVGDRVHVAQLAVLHAEEMRIGCAAAARGA